MMFFTSDNHFNHKKVIEYENRAFSNIEEMHEEMIIRWNKTVNDNDEVYILGDFCFDRKGEIAESILQVLNGRKYMLRGNHDYFLNKINTKKYFEWVKDYHRINYGKIRIILFHYPIFMWDSKHYGSIHLHGHSHNRSKDFEIDLGRAYNVGVDVNDFRPVSLDYILKVL